jgi:hypothetical protein
MNIRDEAISKLNEAYALMKTAGIAERFVDLAEDVTEWKEFEKSKDEDGWEYFKVLECSVCNEDHTLEIAITKSVKHNWQQTLELLMTYRYHDWSFWEKFKEICRHVSAVMWHKKETSDILIKGDDITKFKDLLKKLP